MKASSNGRERADYKEDITKLKEEDYVEIIKYGIPVSDKNGHSAVKSLRVQPGVAALISKARNELNDIIGKRASDNYVMRVAVCIGLREIMAILEQHGVNFTKEKKLISILNKIEYHNYQQDILRHFEDITQKALDRVDLSTKERVELMNDIDEIKSLLKHREL